MVTGNRSPNSVLVFAIRKVHPPLQMEELTSRRWKELWVHSPKLLVLNLINQMRNKAQ